LRGDDQVGAERELEASGEAVALNRGHDRLRQGGEVVDDLRLAGSFPSTVWSADRERRQVVACAESPGRAPHDDHADLVRTGGDGGDRLIEGLEDLGVSALRFSGRSMVR